MENYKFRKPDAAQIAQKDLGSNYSQWHEAEKKPGEKRICKLYVEYSRALCNERDQKQKQLDFLKTQLEYARHYDVSDVSSQERKTKLSIENEQLEQKLPSMQAELQQVEDTIARLQIRNPSLSQQPVLIANAIGSTQDKDSRFRIIAKELILLAMLIFICAFDAYNMYVSLEKFEHDPTRYQILCAFIFCAVLFTSYNLKKNNSALFWTGFLLFVTIANIPQFLGRQPVLGIANLFNSPAHVIVFAISFLGSIVITVINQKLGTESKKVDASIPRLLDSEKQTLDKVQYNQLIKKQDVLTEKLQDIYSSLDTNKRKMENMERESKEIETISLDEKLKAMQKLDQEQSNIQEEIDQLQIQIDELNDQLRDCIQEYRQEVAIQQLISSYPSKVNYLDIHTFKIK